MTDNAIRHYFQDFPAWCAIKNIENPGQDDVVDWAAELVTDNFISEEEAAELVAAAKEHADLMAAPSLSGDATVAAGGKTETPPDESASALGMSPMAGLRKAVEAFAEKAGAAVKGVYNSNSVMMEDCEQDVLDLNNAISGFRACVEKASRALESMHKAMSYQKNEDTMKAISLLGDAIKEIVGDSEGGENGDKDDDSVPDDSLSSEVTAIYDDEVTPPDSSPNPGEEPEA